MPNSIASLCLITLALLANNASAANYVFSSAEQRTDLIELYTSEGCSSCPPADRWLSGLKTDPGLWRKFIPVAFHVDYWNYLGWRDRFSDARFSQRQSNYARHDYVSTVYTPGVMKNGREWRGWSRGTTPPHDGMNKAGVLTATLTDGDAVVDFTPDTVHDRPLVLNIALLGFDLTSRIAAGENAGKILNHDFVAVSYRQITQQPRDGRYRWKTNGLLDGTTAHPTGIALWVTSADNPTPIQATGGWLH